MTPDEQVRAVRFAEGLGKLTRAHNRRGGTILTADEVDGLIWAIRALREATDADAADPA